jgi:PAS domain S-box-containing protein
MSSERRRRRWQAKPGLSDLRLRPPVAVGLWRGFNAQVVHAPLRVEGLPGSADRGRASGMGLMGPGPRLELATSLPAHRREHLASRLASWRARALYDAVNVGIAVLDRRFQYATVNKTLCEMTGAAEADLIGRTVFDAAPEVDERLRATMDGLLEHGSPVLDVELMVRGRDPDDRPSCWLCSFLPMRDREGRVEAVAMVVKEITERKRFEDAILDADRHKNEFLAVLGHELRNPLAAVQSAGDLLEALAPENDRIVRTAAVIRRQTTQMAKLVDGLLDVSRIVCGKVTLDREVLDLGMVLHEVVASHAQQIERRGLRLSFRIPGAPVWVFADRVRIVQVFDNLVSNAVKFTEPPGSITIAIVQDGDSIRAIVEDSGMGIPADFLPQIFEPFRQGDHRQSYAAVGLGLGLALVKGLVDLHGGKVAAESEGVGRGARFTVVLPTAPGPERMPVKPKRVQRRGRVLLVDDHSDGVLTLRELLEVSGHEVMVVPCAPQAVERARSFAPNLVLCDPAAGGTIDGYELARLFRQDAHLSRTRLVALTGFGRDQDRERSQEAGFDDHVVKPVSIDLIEGLLQSVSEVRGCM